MYKTFLTTYLDKSPVYLLITNILFTSISINTSIVLIFIVFTNYRIC